VAGDPFGGSQSAVLVLPHHLTIFLELGYFLSFGKNMIQIQLKNLVIFMLSPNKKNRDGHSIPTSCISSNTYSYYKRIIISV
jgi:hypothetical protein